MAVINLATSVIVVGAGLTLNGDTLSVTSGVSVKATRNASTSGAITAADYYVGYTGTGTATFTLPAAASNAGIEFLIKNRGTATLTLDATGAGGFWGTSLVNTWSLVVGEAVHVISDGTTWVIVGFASGVIQ